MASQKQTTRGGSPGLILDSWRQHRVAFVGSEAAPRGITPNEVLTALADRGVVTPTAAFWNRQVHSSRVRTVSLDPSPSGNPSLNGAIDKSSAVGTADALYTDNDEIALVVFTADCVPVLIAGDRESAAIHAGWRGLESGILAAALQRFTTNAADLAAWIGPSMGPCCYEVGFDVAYRVAARSGPDVVDSERNAKPHLDLAGAALNQLREAGVRDARLVARCTGCSPKAWWSYRRGALRGQRNLAFIWRQSRP